MNRNWRKCFFVVQRLPRKASLDQDDEYDTSISIKELRHLYSPSLLYLHFSISSPRPSDLIFILTTEDPRGNSPSFVVIPPARLLRAGTADAAREGGTREAEGRPLSNSEEGDFSRVSDCDQKTRQGS